MDQFTGSGHIHAEVMSCTDMTGLAVALGGPANRLNHPTSVVVDATMSSAASAARGAVYAVDNGKTAG